MMSKEKRRVPKLRFPGFTEDWEQCKLGSIGSTYTGLSGKTKEDFGHGKAQYITYLNVFQNTISNITMTDNVEIDTTQTEVKYGDVLFTTSSETPEEVGMSSVWLGDTPNTYLNSFCFGFRPKQKIDLYFLGYSLRAPYMRDKIKILAQGISRYNISKNKVMELEISLPNNEEQNLLGNFLRHIDLIITLHQRKLDNIKLKKKALLQKLFPKNGERYPELRFPGFTDAWEQRKLGDFYTFKNGLNKEKVYFGYGDSIVNFTDVFHNRQIYSSTLKGKVCVNKKELENYKVKEGDLFFTRTSETIDEIGFPAVVMEPMERVVFSGFVLRGRAEKYDPLVNIFKSYIFFTNNFRSEMKKKSSMTTRALTSGTALKEMYFSYPKDLEEQTKIGEILLRLDKIITLHQRKLDHLQLQKKALLQQMFV